jgi:hypothetical protein
MISYCKTNNSSTSSHDLAFYSELSMLLQNVMMLHIIAYAMSSER